MEHTLESLIASHRQEITDRWLVLVRRELGVSGPRTALVDHVPQFLDEIAAALRAHRAPERSQVAPQHGVHRLNMGFDLGAVVREYGLLRHAIGEVAGDRGVAVGWSEAEVVGDCIVVGIADAVTQYARQRDAELQHQSSEQFAFVAHELRNPVSSMLIGLDLLGRRGLVSGSERAYRVIERNLLHLRDVVDGWLRMARFGATIDVKREAVSLAALIEEVAESVAVDAEARGVSVGLVVPAAPTVHLDVRLVRSALSNLVRNAIKYTREGERIEVRARVDGQQRVTFEVEDRCGGLPSGVSDEIFAPFVRLDVHHEGEGLGLAIVKQAAEAHGGTVEVRNLPARGCVFVLDVPAGPPERTHTG